LRSKQTRKNEGRSELQAESRTNDSPEERNFKTAEGSHRQVVSALISQEILRAQIAAALRMTEYVILSRQAKDLFQDR